jgi:hypothetical protein
MSQAKRNVIGDRLKSPLAEFADGSEVKSQDEVEELYRKATQKYHPNGGDEPDSDKWQEAERHRELLKDERSTDEGFDPVELMEPRDGGQSVQEEPMEDEGANEYTEHSNDSKSISVRDMLEEGVEMSGEEKNYRVAQTNIVGGEEADNVYALISHEEHDLGIALEFDVSYEFSDELDVEYDWLKNGDQFGRGGSYSTDSMEQIKGREYGVENLKEAYETAVQEIGREAVRQAEENLNL